MKLQVGAELGNKSYQRYDVKAGQSSDLGNQISTYWIFDALNQYDILSFHYCFHISRTALKGELTLWTVLESELTGLFLKPYSFLPQVNMKLK